MSACCTLPPALLAEWLGSCTFLHVTVVPPPGERGDGGWNKSQHTKLTLEQKILLPLLLGFKLQPFDHESGALNNKLISLAAFIWHCPFVSVPLALSICLLVFLSLNPKVHPVLDEEAACTTIYPLQDILSSTQVQCHLPLW